jgi:hypothetical protein
MLVKRQKRYPRFGAGGEMCGDDLENEDLDLAHQLSRCTTFLAMLHISLF